MQDYQSMLKEQIEKRLGRDNQAYAELERMNRQQQALTRAPVETRRDLSSYAQFVDDTFGGNLASTVDKPESVETSLRRAIQTRLQTPRQQGLQALQAGLQSKLNSAKLNSLDKEGQRQRESLLKSKQGMAVLKNKELQSKAQAYQDMVNKYGYSVTGANRAEIEGAYRELQIAYKNAAELGVIAGPDMMLIEGIAPPSTGIGGLFQNTVKGGQEGVNRALNQLKRSRQSEIDNNEKILRTVYPNAYTDNVFNSMFTGNQPQQPSGSIEMNQMSDEELKRIIGGR